MTWHSELYTMMNQIANVLKSHGVEKGDRVAIYMPACPLAVASMLACARIGAVHSVVFAGFSAEALASRIVDGIDSRFFKRFFLLLFQVKKKPVFLISVISGSQSSYYC